MKTGWRAYLALLLIILSSVACAHRQYVKAGDEAMAEDDPFVALEQYRAAQERKPSSEDIARRVDAAEEEIVQLLSAEIDTAVERGDFGIALGHARRATEWVEGGEQLDRLEGQVEEFVLDEAEKRRERGEYESAVRLIDGHVDIFGKALMHVAEIEEDIRKDWAEELRAEGQAHMDGGRHGAAATYFTMAAETSEVSSAGRDGAEAMRRAVHFDSWGLVADADDDEVRLDRVLNALFSRSLPPAIVDDRRTDNYGVEARLHIEMSPPEFRTWQESERHSDEYRSGTQSVPNPAYQRRRDDIYHAERAVLEAERNVSRARRDLRQARRELRERRRDGRATHMAENRVSRAYRNLDRRERQLEDRYYEKERLVLELQQIDRYVDEPVYSTHSYEVVVQRAELVTRVAVTIEVVARDFEAATEFEITEAAATRRYDSQPEIDLPRRHDDPPSEAQLRAGLDAQIGDEIGRFAAESFEVYRDQVIGDLTNLSRDDEIDMLARYILMNPGQRNPDHEDRLEHLVEFDRIGGLLLRMARDEARLR